MNFELGKEYIVKVSEEGIIPIEEFKSDRFYDKDHDDLDFLTEEEKKQVVNQVLDKIKVEIENNSFRPMMDDDTEYIFADWVNEIIDRYKTRERDD